MSNERARLEERFHSAMEGVYDAALRECRYRATRFIQMVHSDGGLATARRLIASDELSDGLTSLWQCGRLDLTVENLVLQSEWRELFTDAERSRAAQRLRALGFPPPADPRRIDEPA